MARWVYTYRCGLHSGIPKCCMRFFVRVWTHVWHVPELREQYLPKEKSIFGYVPCPDCLAKGKVAKVPVKSCECDFLNCMLHAKEDSRVMYLFNKKFGFTETEMLGWAKRRPFP